MVIQFSLQLGLSCNLVELNQSLEVWEAYFLENQNILYLLFICNLPCSKK